MARTGTALRRAGALSLSLSLAFASGGCDRPLSSPAPDASTDAPSPAPSGAPAVSGAASPAEPPKPPKVAIGPGDDHPPERWTTPAESLKAAPPWALEYSYSDNPKAERENYAPQFPDALFMEAPKSGVVNPGEQVLLACVVSFAGFCDGGLKGLFRAEGPELDVELVIGRAGKLIAHGGEDVRSIEISVPLVSLGPADRLLLRVFDRDGDGRESLGVVTLTPRSLATKAKQDPAVECRVLGREAVEAKLASEIAAADKELDRLSDPAPVLTEETLGVESVRRSLRGPLRRLAGLVGWADPRVARRVEWASRIEARMSEARARFINEEADRLARRARYTYFRRPAAEVEALGIACGEAAVKPYAKAIKDLEWRNSVSIGCILRVHAVNHGEEVMKLDTSFHFGWKAVVGRSDGQTQKAHMLTMEGPEVKREDRWSSPVIPPGAKGTVVLGIAADVQPEGDGAPRPRLVVMNPFASDGPVLFSLDAPPDRPIPDGGAEP